jgi:hypothetical protein
MTRPGLTWPGLTWPGLTRPDPIPSAALLQGTEPDAKAPGSVDIRSTWETHA